jgi:sialic acid synthase SpsE
MSVNFIAEVSSNHNQDIERCFDFIDTAAEIGCNAVKFQLFKINQLFSQEILLNSKDHRQRSSWELPEEWIPRLYERCTEKRIQFSATPFYLDAVEILFDYVSFYKIASYELLWDELLISCARTGKPIILSTGMANLGEIMHAVKVLEEHGAKDIRLMHCVSVYPAPFSDVNLSAINTISSAVNKKVGWSDHTVDPAVLYRAILKWGASDIEFHLDLDGSGEEFNSGHCWLPSEISDVIQNINRGYQCDGTGIKEPIEQEDNERSWRADPADGLRPLIRVRKNFVNESE